MNLEYHRHCMFHEKSKRSTRNFVFPLSPLPSYFNLSFSISYGSALSRCFVPTYFPFPTSRYSSFQYYLILCILRSFSGFYARSLLPFCHGNNKNNNTNNSLGGLKPTTYSTYSLAAKLLRLDTASRAQLGYNIQKNVLVQ